MPASTTNVIELVFGVKDTTEITDKINKIQDAAIAMTNGIKDGLNSAKQLPQEAMTILSKSGESLNSSIDKSFNSSLKGLNSWFSFVMDKFKSSGKETSSLFSNAYMGNLNNFLTSIMSNVFKVKTFITETTDLAYKKLVDITKFLYKDVAIEWFSTMGKLYKDSKRYIQEEYPIISKGIEGLWLVTKTATFGAMKGLLGFIGVAVESVKKLTGYVGVVKEKLEQIGISIAAAAKVAYDFGAVIGKKTLEVIQFIGKISGITYALKGAQKVASFALKVTGVGLAVKTIKDFVLGAKGQVGGMFSVFDTIANTIESAFAPISNILYEMAIQLSELVATILMPFFRALADILSNTLAYFNMITEKGNSFSGILGTVRNIILQLSDALVGIFKFLFSTVIPMLSPILDLLIESIKDFVDVLMPVLSNIGGQLSSILANLFSGLIKPLNMLLSSVFTVFKSIVTLLGELLPPIINLLGELLPNVFNSLVTVTKSLANLVTSLVPVLSFLVKIILSLVSFLLPPVVWLLEKILFIIIELVNVIVISLTYAFESFGDITVTVFNSILDSIKFVFNWTMYFIKGIANAISSVFTGATNAAIFSFDSIIEAIKYTFNNILAFFGYIGGKITSALGIDTIGTSLTGILPTIVKMLTFPLDMLRNLINSTIISPLRAILNYDMPVIGTLSSTLGISTPKFLAEGGIVTKPTNAIIAENGPEIVLPLKRDIIKEVLPEIIPLSQSLKLDDNTENMHSIINLLKETNTLLRYLVEQQNITEMQTKPNISFTMQGFARG